jgi:hypothetical protein
VTNSVVQQPGARSEPDGELRHQHRSDLRNHTSADGADALEEGECAEIMIYERALSVAELGVIETYLAAATK